MPRLDLWTLHPSNEAFEAFVPVNPYKPKPNTGHPDPIHLQLIRQIYCHALLHIPTIYFGRVCRVFEDAEVSRHEVERMVEGLEKGENYRWPASHEWVVPNVSPALVRFKESWESFVDSVLKEWKTLNVVSALLLTAILTIIQIQEAATPPFVTAPFIRTTAFLSLVCALMSLVYGCVYILRFGTMKDMYKAAQWAEEAHKGSSTFWNVWVLLAMPAVWITWSLIFFCISILDFVWDQPFSDASTNNSAPTFQSTNVLAVSSLSKPDKVALAPRIIISLVFLLGLLYFVLVVRTFRRWGKKKVTRHESMETGRPWSPNTARDASLSLGPSLESRFSRRNEPEMGDDEKTEMKQNRTEPRVQSMDSEVV